MKFELPEESNIEDDEKIISETRKYNYVEGQEKGLDRKIRKIVREEIKKAG